MFNVVGVEIDVHLVTVVIIDLHGQMKAYRTQRHSLKNGPKSAVTVTAELVLACIDAARTDRSKLLGIGLAVPNPIVTMAPGILSAESCERWVGSDVRRMLEEALRLPVLVESDASLGAMAEHWWGAGEGLQNVSFLKLASNLRAGHVLRGEVYRGASGAAGEIGHVSLGAKGKQCICGARGCAALSLSTEAVVGRLRRAYDGKLLKLADFTRLAAQQEPTAVALVAEVAFDLAQLIVDTIVNVVNPEVIVLGGELSVTLPDLLVPLRRFVRERTRDAFDAEKIVASKLGEQAIAEAAALLYLNAALSRLQIASHAGSLRAVNFCGTEIICASK